MVMLLQVEKVVHYFINLGENQFREFMGRRALLVIDYVDSMRGGPWLLNHVSKIWRAQVWENKTEHTCFDF